MPLFGYATPDSTAVFASKHPHIQYTKTPASHLTMSPDWVRLLPNYKPGNEGHRQAGFHQTPC